MDDKIKIVSCPTCGRCNIDLINMANEVEERIIDIDKNMTVAIMGCAVNGPGEAREADIGIAGGKGEGLLFKKGEIVRKINGDRLVEELLEENDFVDLIKIIHYIVPRVVKNKFYDEEGYKIENKYGYMKNAIYNNINKLNINSEELWEDDLVL